MKALSSLPAGTVHQMHQHRRSRGLWLRDTYIATPPERAITGTRVRTTGAWPTEPQENYIAAARDTVFTLEIRDGNAQDERTITASYVYLTTRFHGSRDEPEGEWHRS